MIYEGLPKAIANAVSIHLSCIQDYLVKIAPVYNHVIRGMKEAGIDCPEGSIGISTSGISVIADSRVRDVRRAISACLPPRTDGTPHVWEKTVDPFSPGLMYSMKYDDVSITVTGLPPTCRIEYVEETKTKRVARVICDDVKEEDVLP